MNVRFDTPEKTIEVEKFFNLGGTLLACSTEGIFYQLQRSLGPTLGYRLELADDGKLENIADNMIKPITESQAIAELWRIDETSEGDGDASAEGKTAEPEGSSDKTGDATPSAATTVPPAASTPAAVPAPATAPTPAAAPASTAAPPPAPAPAQAAAPAPQPAIESPSGPVPAVASASSPPPVAPTTATPSA
ncbi:MAG: hypothetical protein LBR22_01690 [Desulfovibrio sp.]|jgi:hypothetical protein|nr:hypothetical protein [Desulfovibrio sp.]